MLTNGDFLGRARAAATAQGLEIISLRDAEQKINEQDHQTEKSP
jgi:hypothetical protein